MSYEAEEKIIGSLLIRNSALDEITFIEPDMFADELFGKMFYEFQRAQRENRELDRIVLKDSISADDFPPDKVEARLRQVEESVITSAGIRSVAWDGVLKPYRARRFVKSVNKVTGDPARFEDEYNTLTAELEEIRPYRNTQTKTVPQIVGENKDKYFCETDTPRVNLGFRGLDEILGGLEGGDLTIIGARPAVGKSAFALQVILHFASLGKRCGYFNLEMQEKQIYERLLAAKSGVGLTRIRRAKAFNTDEEKSAIDKANEELAKQDNIVITTGSKRISDIRAESKAAGYDVIVIDYLQLVKSDRTYGSNRYAEVGAISHAVKALAMELNIPIIGLCQLNRSSEGREDKEPTMGELRESGDFEQDASVILLLWNTNKDDRSEKCIKVEKQRQGRTGKVKLKFDGGHMRFEESEPTISTEEFMPVPEDMELVFD